MPEYGAGSSGRSGHVCARECARTDDHLVERVRSGCRNDVDCTRIDHGRVRIAGGGVGVLDNAVEESGECVRVAAAGAAIGVGHGADVDRARCSVRHISRRVTAEMRDRGAGADRRRSRVGRLVNAGGHAGEGIGRVIGGRICDHADIDRAVLVSDANALPAWAAVL